MEMRETKQKLRGNFPPGDYSVQCMRRVSRSWKRRMPRNTPPKKACQISTEVHCLDKESFLGFGRSKFWDNRFLFLYHSYKGKHTSFLLLEWIYGRCETCQKPWATGNECLWLFHCRLSTSWSQQPLKFGTDETITTVYTLSHVYIYIYAWYIIFISVSFYIIVHIWNLCAYVAYSDSLIKKLFDATHYFRPQAHRLHSIPFS